MTYGYEDRAFQATERKAGALPFIRRRPEPTPSGNKKCADILYLFSRKRAGEQIQNIYSAASVRENKYKISVQPKPPVSNK
jgi:hypothetical protein